MPSSFSQWRNGSTFVAGHAADFLVSEDKNFRPINLRWGPGGEIYVAVAERAE